MKSIFRFSAALSFCIALIGTRVLGADTNFVVQPPISTNNVGVTLMLSVVQMQDTNYPMLSYTWLRNGTPLSDNGHVTGSQTDTLMIDSATLADAGLYTAQIFLQNALLSSPTSQVHLLDNPQVQGIRQENTGGTVRLIADATGGLLSYQWMWQGQDLPGATSSALVFANPYTDASAGYYSVRVTNLLGQAMSAAPGFLLTKSAPSGTYEGLFYETNQVAHDASGYFQITLSGSKSTFSGKLQIGKSRYPFSGKLSTSHETSVTIQRKGERSLDLHLQLVTTNDDSRCIGTLTDGVWDATVQGFLVYYNKQRPTSLAKNYTLALVNTNASASEPNGSCSARLIVNSSGKATLSGYAATGVSISQSRGLSRSGYFPLYIVQGKGRERVIGWLRVANQTSSSITGDSVVWTKEPGDQKMYPGGFYISLSAIGSTWPDDPMGKLGFNDGIASFFGGGLFGSEFPTGDFVRVTAKEGRAFKNIDAPEKVKISINRKSGVLKGSLRHPITGKALTIRGVALYQQNRARGCFLGTGTSGNFTLMPNVAVP
jgi:hypothetical protein